MDIKTKFNIGDKVYYIGRIGESGATVNKYVIDDIRIYRVLDNKINIQYSIRNPKMAQDRHSVFDGDIYLLNEIDKVLDIIKEKLCKEGE